MHDGENPIKDGPVIIGIGKSEENVVLAKAGAKDFYLLEEVAGVIERRAAGVRPEDTLIMLNPKYLSRPQLTILAAQGTHVQVVGNSPILTNTEANKDTFHGQEHLVEGVPPLKNKGGRPVKFEPTKEQLEDLRHDYQVSGKAPRLIVEDFNRRNETDITVDDLRNLMIRKFGHKRRSPV